MSTNMDAYFAKRAKIIKTRAKDIIGSGGSFVQVKHDTIDGKAESYTDYQTISEVLGYIKYLEEKVKELEIRNSVENTVWEEALSEISKATIKKSIEKSLEEEGWRN